MNKGNLIVVSGFSGAGKGTVMNRLISEKKDMPFQYRQQQEK